MFLRTNLYLGNTVPERGRKPANQNSLQLPLVIFRKYSPREGTETIKPPNQNILQLRFRKYSPREGTETVEILTTDEVNNI